jgi:hypothetical protein
LAALVFVGVLFASAVACGSDGDDGDGASGSTSSSARQETALDITRLPVGDNQFSSTPTAGKIYTCRTQFGGGGASTQGPWFNGDGTWDRTKKIAVDGDVKWDAASVSFTLEGDVRVVRANALPEHGTGVFPIQPPDDAYQYDRNPNSIRAQELALELPANPTVAEAPGCIGGEVGIAIDGVPIFDGFDAGGRDAVAWEVQDACDGHPQMGGVYHYHDLSPCLDDAGDGHSALVGYAYDGFGIFGRRGEDGTELRTRDLDECHGHTHAAAWDGTSVELYHYHATFDFPYTASCFRGTSVQQGPTGG